MDNLRAVLDVIRAKFKRALKVSRETVTGTLLTLPWFALGAFALISISDAGFALDALKYGLVKTVAAVFLAWFADRSLFWYSPPQKHANEGQFMPQLRRAIIFFGVCVVMLLT